MQQIENPWESVFRQSGRVFLEPHEDMAKLATMLEKRKAKTVLDLGCGTGRHIIFFTKQGFDVYGLDSSTQGLKLTKDWLEEEALCANLSLQNMSESLPYPNNFFDAVISVQVIHHGTLTAIRKVTQEIDRVLKPGGLLFVTVTKLKNQAGSFEQIEPNTFVPLDGREKGLPHHYFTPETLSDEFGNYQVESIRIDSEMHYCFTGLKR